MQQVQRDFESNFSVIGKATGNRWQQDYVSPLRGLRPPASRLDQARPVKTRPPPLYFGDSSCPLAGASELSMPWWEVVGFVIYRNFARFHEALLIPFGNILSSLHRQN